MTTIEFFYWISGLLVGFAIGGKTVAYFMNREAERQEQKSNS